MKRIGGLLLAVLLLMISLPAALGAGTSSQVTMGIDVNGTGESVYTSLSVVQVTIDGVPVDSDIPAILWNNRTMVPIRVISEAMGAEVEWYGETREASIIMADRAVQLKIGSAQAQVNGVTMTLYDNVPAILVNYNGATRTMVPLRFVSEQLGAQAEWIGETRTAAISMSTPTQPPYQVTGIETDADAGTIHITTTETPEYVVTDMGDRIVVDVKGAVLASGSDGTIEVNSSAIYRVRYAQHGSSLYAGYAYTVRVVLDVRTVITYENNIVLEVQDDGLLLTTVNVPEIQPGAKTIVLDAGHGGTDPGAVYEGVNEKDINLAVTKKVEAILLSYGYNVIMTRSTDVYVGLYDRAAIANDAQADIFVAMHSNAAPSVPSAVGAYTYYYYSSTQGIRLAKSIQAALCEATGANDRGVVSSQNLVVLRETDMPAVLVEMGFMTNSGELKNLTDPAYQDKLAAGIAEGIVRYFNGS